jgi:DNA-binding LacI/PurR family transcriptional regulator
MASVRDIAKQAKVSKTTVSMVLRNLDGVSESMRLRVQEAVQYLRAVEETRTAEEMSASMDRGVTMRKDEKISSLLVLHPTNYHSSTVFHEILRGIQAAASVYNLQLSLAFNDSQLLNTSLEEFYFSNAVLKPVGVLLIGARTEEPLVERLCERSIPMVLVGRKAHDDHASAVGRNELEMARQATNYLFDLGHRTIAFLGASDEFEYALERLRGYRQTCEERGGALDEYLVHCGFDACASAKFLMEHPEVTAAVFLNELLASEVLPIVQAAGKVVPDDLSAVAFDDTDIARNFNPPLTTISFPFFQEGFWAVRLIMEQVRQPTVISAQVILGATLVKRMSCSAPKKLS